MSNLQQISLIVLSHGLWGNKNHMGYIEKKLDEKYGDAIHIVRKKKSLNEWLTHFFLLLVECQC